MALKFLNNGYFAGKVGIGIESPTTLLHLDQSSNDRAGGLYIERNASNYGLSMFVNSGGYGIIGSNGTFTKDILTLDLSSGNVGIGTTSPSAKLDVVGNVVIATTGVTDNLLLTSVDTSAASAPDLVLFRNAAIADNDTLGVVEYKGKNGMVPSSSTPFLYNAIYSRINDASNNHSSLSFHANKGNGTGAYVDAVHISAIGTNNSAAGALLINPSSDFELPAYNLDVKGTGNFTGLVSGITPVAAANFVTKAYVDGGGGAGSGFLPLSAGSSYPLSGVLYAGQGVKFTGGTIAAATTVLHTNNVVYARGGSGGMFLQNADGSDGMFIANDHVRIETGSSERIRIIANGNVGIGTTTPTAKLDVRLSTATGKVAELHNNAGYGVGFTVESDGGVNTINSESNQALAFATNGASNERMRITTGGDVGIGTTSPSAKLHVAGTGLFTGLVSGITPVAAANFVTKAYVDGSGGGTGPFLPLAGGTMTGVAGVVFPDAFKLNLGTGDDLQIYHTGSNAFLENDTGGLYIRQQVDNNDVYFQADRGDGNLANYFYLSGADTNALDTRGATVFPDKSKIFMGDSKDLEIYHDGSNSYIKDSGTGSLYIRATNFALQSAAGTDDYITTTENAEINLFYNNSKKFETTSTGVTVTGDGTFSGSVASVGLDVQRNSGSSVDILRITSADVATTIQRIENTSDAANGFGRIEFKTNAATGQVSGRGGFKFIDGDANDILYLDNDNAAATFAGNILLNGGVLYKNSGTIEIKAQTIRIKGVTTNENLAVFTENGSVSLNYDNNTKLSTGAVSVGTATTTGGTLIDGWKTTTQANAINNTTIATTAYVNNKIALIPAGLVFQGTWDARTAAEGGAAGNKGNPALTSGVGTTGNFYIVSNAGSVNLDGITDWKVGDWAVFIEQGASDQWEKIDNSSVLDGIGTGGSVAGWAGSGTSNTLTNSPITFSGNNVTFAGSVRAEDRLDLYNGTKVLQLKNVNNEFTIRNGNSGLVPLTIASAGNATFTGIVGMGSTGIYAGTVAQLNLPGRGLAIKNDKNGSNNNWSYINNTAPNSESNINFHTGNNAAALTLAHNGDATFAGDVTIPEYLKHTNDADTYFGFSANNQVLFHVGGSDRLIITSGGNVGIGTTTPNAKLEVASGQAKTVTSGVEFARFGTSNEASNYATLTCEVKGGAAAADRKWIFQTIEAGVANAGDIVFQPSGGNVGIGTDNPLQKLQVNGQVLFRTTTADGSKNRFQLIPGGSSGAANLYLYYGNTGDGTLSVRINAQGTSYLNGGNVGIGTTSPAAILHLAKDNAVLRIEATTNGQNCSTWYRANGNNQWETGCNIGAGTDYQIYDRLNGASRMVVGHNGNVTIPGNVGIGTTNPGSKLQVAGEIRVADGNKGTPSYTFTSDTNTGMYSDTADVIDFTAGGTKSLSVTTSGATVYGSALMPSNAAILLQNQNNNNQYYIRNSGGTNATFQVGQGAPGSNVRFFINGSGNVGIGNTASTASVKLEVTGNTLLKNSNGVGDLYLGNYATANHFRFHTNNANTYFDMNCGDIYWRQGSSTRYQFFPSTANMTVQGTITQNSDARIKENVVEISDCISKVQAMRGVYYNRTDFNTEVTKVGVIAQEVEAVLPELVLESPETGLKSVAYSELTSVLINAIKEQQEIIEDLKTRITKLEN